MSQRIESLLRFVADFQKFHTLCSPSDRSMPLQKDELSVDELDWVAAAKGNVPFNTNDTNATKPKP